MREMNIMLGWLGWVWTAAVFLFLAWRTNSARQATETDLQPTGSEAKPARPET